MSAASSKDIPLFIFQCQDLTVNLGLVYSRLRCAFGISRFCEVLVQHMHGMKWNETKSKH